MVFTILMMSITLTGCDAKSSSTIEASLPVSSTHTPAAVNSPDPGITSTTEKTTQPSCTPSAFPESSPTPTQTSTPLSEIEILKTPVSCVQDGCLYNAHQPFLRPVPQGFNRSVASTYRYGSTQYGTRPAHSGVEFVNPQGTPVLAAYPGTVVFAGSDEETVIGKVKDTYGNVIILQHQFAWLEEPVYSLYGHLSSLLVKSGDEVSQGQEIGLVGSTGTAVGSHLHFEVRVGHNDYRHTSNPELWLEPDTTMEEANLAGTLIVRLHHKSGTIYSIEISIQDFSDPNATYHHTIYTESYSNRANADPFWKENLVVGELVSGTYRISFTRHDRSYKKFVEIEPNKITLVEFDID